MKHVCGNDKANKVAVNCKLYFNTFHVPYLKQDAYKFAQRLLINCHKTIMLKWKTEDRVEIEIEVEIEHTSSQLQCGISGTHIPKYELK